MIPRIGWLSTFIELEGIAEKLTRHPQHPGEISCEKAALCAWTLLR